MDRTDLRQIEGIWSRSLALDFLKATHQTGGSLFWFISKFCIEIPLILGNSNHSRKILRTIWSFTGLDLRRSVSFGFFLFFIWFFLDFFVFGMFIWDVFHLVYLYGLYLVGLGKRSVESAHLLVDFQKFSVSIFPMNSKNIPIDMRLS